MQSNNKNGRFYQGCDVVCWDDTGSIAICSATEHLASRYMKLNLTCEEELRSFDAAQLGLKHELNWMGPYTHSVFMSVVSLQQ